MLLSLNWLKTYVDLPKNLTAKKLAADLTMTTCEVERVENLAEKFDNMVVGKIISIKNHPNADKLKIVMTDIGNQKLEIRNQGQKNIVQIVCGGTNLRENMLVAVALPGAKVRWHGEGESVVMEKAKIRGEESFGMICASSEIGLADVFPAESDREIIDLSGIKKIKAGQNLAEALGMDDMIIEIENKTITNRPDLWNHLGIARELSVIYNTSLKAKNFQFPISNFQKNFKSKISNSKLDIQIDDKQACSRYIGCLVKNVKVAASPEWLQKSLASVGIRPINNIVDITNYVMLDVGQPMHAFDKAKLYQKQFPISKIQFPNDKNINIIVRKAKNGEKIKSLDGIERKLDDSMLIIADAKKPIAIAGIMGGEESGIDEKTNEIIFEAANFNAMSIRKTSQKLGLRSESSNRFEKNLDPNFAELAMARALKLVKELCPEAEIVAYQDENLVKEKKIVIKVDHSFLEKKIGQTLDMKDIVKKLESLGFKVDTKKDKKEITKYRASSRNSAGLGAGNNDIIYQIEVPSWRATGDIFIPEDIVEEVARVIGYDNLAEHKILVELAKPKIQMEQILENRTKKFLALAGGFSEVFNYPWAKEITLKILGKNDKIISVANPQSDDNSALQNSLIPNLLKNTEDNLRYFDEFKIFELARVYLPEFNKIDSKFQDKLPNQPKMLAGVVVTQKDKNAFLELKGVLEGLFKKLETRNWKLVIPSERSEAMGSFSYLDKEKLLSIEIDGKEIGFIGELKENIYRQFGFKNRKVALFEINFDKLVLAEQKTEGVKYAPLPQFPSIIRDLAFELDWKVRWSEIVEGILRFAQNDKLIKNVEFLSEFGLGDRKSVAFRIVYQADRTLKEEEVEVVEKKIVEIISKKFNARLRAALGK
ncbi:MAG: phenylalanine--tRNA ligase subunit beta [Patescibacteria group bacterium]|nr:phenylalanine--tRNA ligase subunit beta [Patescibacteria group bacterium]